MVRDGILKNFPMTAFPKSNSDYCDQNYYYRNKNFILTKQTSKVTFNFAFSSLFANLKKLSLAPQGFLRSKMYLFSKGLSSAFGEKVHQTDNILILATKKILGAVKLFIVPSKMFLKMFISLRWEILLT